MVDGSTIAMFFESLLIERCMAEAEEASESIDGEGWSLRLLVDVIPSLLVLECPECTVCIVLVEDRAARMSARDMPDFEPVEPMVPLEAILVDVLGTLYADAFDPSDLVEKVECRLEKVECRFA
jgi:hypothetical protein